MIELIPRMGTIIAHIDRRICQMGVFDRRITRFIARRALPIEPRGDLISQGHLLIRASGRAIRQMEATASPMTAVVTRMSEHSSPMGLVFSQGGILSGVYSPPLVTWRAPAPAQESGGAAHPRRE
jgi:hypothetical protein